MDNILILHLHFISGTQRFPAIRIRSFSDLDAST